MADRSYGKFDRFWTAALAALAVIAIAPVPAFAYVGPGAGLSLVGSVIGLLCALLTAVGMILSWPIRALFRRIRAADSAKIGTEAAQSVESAFDPPSSN